MESPSMLAPPTHVASPSTSPPVSFIHRYYILVKAHYFFFFAAFGALYPIINITLRSRGLSNVELSYINIIIPFLVFVTNPLLGLIADRSRRYLSTFNVVLVAVTILYSIMFILPTVKTHKIQADVVHVNKVGRFLDFCASQEVATKCASRSECGCAYQANCISKNSSDHQKQFYFTFTMSSQDVSKEIRSTADEAQPSICGIQYRVPVDAAIKQYTKNGTISAFYHNPGSNRLATCEITCSIAHYCHGPRHSNQMRYILFYSVLFILGTNFLSNAIPLGVSIGFASLPRPELFGEQRVYGTIGFGIFAFGASRVYQLFKTEFVYIIMFSIITTLCIIVTSFIRIQPIKKDPNTIVIEEREIENGSVGKKKKKAQFDLSALLPLLKKVDVLVFLSLTFIWGMSYAGLDPYLYLYIDEIAACQSHSIVGWMSLVASAGEVLGFFLAARLIKAIGANIASIIILLAFAVRFSGYYYISEPYFLIPVETMHFFNFGILYVLIVQKADSIAPPGLSGTLQGVAIGLSFGLGRGVGLLIASSIYTLIEQRLLFLIIAIFNLIAAVIYSIYFILTRNRSKKSVGTNSISSEQDAALKQEPLLTAPTHNKINE